MFYNSGVAALYGPVKVEIGALAPNPTLEGHAPMRAGCAQYAGRINDSDKIGQIAKTTHLGRKQKKGAPLARPFHGRTNRYFIVIRPSV